MNKFIAFTLSLLLLLSDGQWVHALAPQTQTAQEDLRRSFQSYGSGQTPLPVQRNDKKTRNTEAKAVGLGASVGAAVGVGVGLASQAELNKRNYLEEGYFDHLLLRDKPVDQMPILVAHNAASLPGTGTPFVASNQHLDMTEILEQTPVRGFELDVWSHQGDLVVRHGAYQDPLTNESLSFEDALGELDQWLSQPGNENEVIFIGIENNANSGAPFTEIRDYFSDRLLGTREFNDMRSELGRSPTLEEIAESGNQVVLLNFHPGLASEINGEDRSLLSAIDGLHPELVSDMDTERFDQLITQPGIIGIDQISHNDPRFFKPEDRDILGLSANMSVLGETYYSDSEHASALLGLSAGSNAALGSFSLLMMLIQTRDMRRRLNSVASLAQRQLQSLSDSDVRAFLKKSKKATLQESDIRTMINSQIVKSLSVQSLIMGLFSTFSLTSSLFLMALLFPVAFNTLIMSGFIVLGLGVVLSIVLSAYVWRRAGTNLQSYWKQSSTQTALEYQMKRMGHVDVLLESRSLSDRRLSRLSQMSFFLLGSQLMLRFSAMGKYSFPLLGVIAWAVLPAILILSVIVRILTHQIEQKKRLRNLPGELRRSLFMGPETWQLQNYAYKHYERLSKILDLPQDVNQTNIQKKTLQDSDLEMKLHKQYIREHLNNRWQTFLSKASKRTRNLDSSEQFKKFAFDQLNDQFTKPFFKTIAFVAALAVSIVLLGYFLPVYSGVLFISALIVMGTGFMGSLAYWSYRHKDNLGSEVARKGLAGSVTVSLALMSLTMIFSTISGYLLILISASFILGTMVTYFVQYLQNRQIKAYRKEIFSFNLDEDYQKIYLQASQLLNIDYQEPSRQDLDFRIFQNQFSRLKPRFSQGLFEQANANVDDLLKQHGVQKDRGDLVFERFDLDVEQLSAHLRNLKVEYIDMPKEARYDQGQIIITKDKAVLRLNRRLLQIKSEQMRQSIQKKIFIEKFLEQNLYEYLQSLGLGIEGELLEHLFQMEIKAASMVLSYHLLHQNRLGSSNALNQYQSVLQKLNGSAVMQDRQNVEQSLIFFKQNPLLPKKIYDHFKAQSALNQSA